MFDDWESALDENAVVNVENKGGEVFEGEDFKLEVEAPKYEVKELTQEEKDKHENAKQKK